MTLEAQARLSVEARLENLKLIRDFVEAQANAAGFDDAKSYDLVLAVDEAATNIIMHGYGADNSAADSVVEALAQRAATALSITLRDRARPFDPTAMPIMDELPPLVDRLPGGLGIFLIRKTMDGINYRRTADGWNELTLVLARPADLKKKEE